jgi:hypothetical protein
MRWLDRIQTSAQAARLDTFLRAYSDGRGTKEADRLIQAIGPRAKKHWQGRDLIKAITKARRKWLTRYSKLKTAEKHLPRPNPSYSGSKIG